MGYEWVHGDQCLTLFSASNYCRNSGNMGAVMRFRPDSVSFDEYLVAPLKEIRRFTRVFCLVQFDSVGTVLLARGVL